MSQPSDPNLFLSFFLLLIISGLTAYYADKKGRNPFIWFVIGILISVLAPIILFFLPSLKDQKEESKQTKPTVLPPPTPISTPIMNADEDKLWYYLDKDHNQYGPVSLIALKELWDRGQLELNSYVWTESMEKWDRVDNLPGLKTSLKRPPPL